MNSLNRPPKIAILGGGISGLAAAQRIQTRQPDADLTLFEASDRLGGLIQSTEENGFLFEHTADSFIVSDELPWAGQLCDELNLDLIPTSQQHRGAMILRGSQLHPVPDGLHLMTIEKLWPMLTTPLLSWRGRLRVLAERFVAKRSAETENSPEESLADFAVRRFGNEMFEQIVQPLVSGIYTADPTKLSMSAALPQFVKLEARYGSMFQAGAARRTNTSDRGARYSLFRSPPGGMQKLIDTLQAKLASVAFKMQTPVLKLERTVSGGNSESGGSEFSPSESSWTVHHEAGDERFDAVVLALPAPRAAKLLDFDSQLATPVRQIEHVSTSIVCLGYRREQIAHPLNAFGCVVPAVERRKVLAISFTSQKFATHAPEGHVLLRAFVGGAMQPEVAALPDAELQAVVKQELAELLGATGEPVATKIIRWPETTPQYLLGHEARVQQIEDQIQQLPGLALAGNAYHGVGIPQCVRGGWQAADRLLDSPS